MACCRIATPFALPRVNAAWDIDGEGNNVLRGGYGMFYNRTMGNVEYDNSLRLPPNAYHVTATQGNSASVGNGLGLTYDTAHLISMADRLGSIGINTPTPDSFKWPTHAQLQRVLRAAGRLEPGGRGGLRRHARPRPGQPE